jgi:hypothetical protein
VNGGVVIPVMTVDTDGGCRRWEAIQLERISGIVQDNKGMACAALNETLSAVRVPSGAWSQEVVGCVEVIEPGLRKIIGAVSAVTNDLAVVPVRLAAQDRAAV